MEYKFYKFTGITEIRPYIEGEDISEITVSKIDTPRKGGMIARDFENYEDLWYISEDYFENFTEVTVE